jgi:predicted transcriptional regulator
MRQQLLKDAVQVLEDFNFDVLLYPHSCLDIAAQKKDLSVLIKVLENVDGFRPEHAAELKRLAAALNACPLILGETTKAERLVDGTAYERHGITALTLATLRDSLAGAYPQKISSQGRVIAEIDGSAMQEARSRRGLTMDDFAQQISLTKESIYLYEHERMRVKYEIARRIEGFLDARLVMARTPFQKAEERPQPKGEIAEKLALLDFEVYPFKKLDFELVASDPKDRVMLGSGTGLAKAVNLSDFFRTFLAVVDESKTQLPAIDRKELLSLDSKKDFLRLLRERSAR